ncbi:MAG: OmpA family protein [Myxococcota bacterium]|nr:OmpA family protein [Myxococcota bacterium]
MTTPHMSPRVAAGLVALLLGTACGGATTELATDPEAPLEVELRGNRIVFNHKLQFEWDSAQILEESYPILDRICELLAEHEEIFRVQVQGHTSVDGQEQHNQELSAARAEAVAEYLRGHGVTQEITSQGYGETYPVCRDETEECHLQNRRVEFFVDSR